MFLARIALFILPIAACGAQIIYVDAAGGSDLPSYGNASQPLKTLIYALQHILTFQNTGISAEVILSPGEYTYNSTLRYNASGLDATIKTADGFAQPATIVIYQSFSGCASLHFQDVRFVAANATEAKSMINFDDANICPLRFTRCNFQGTWESGVLIFTHHKLDVKDCNFTNLQLGQSLIQAIESPNVTIAGSIFENNSFFDTLVLFYASNSLYMKDSSMRNNDGPSFLLRCTDVPSASLVGCTFEDTVAITFENVQTLTVTGCVITNDLPDAFIYIDRLSSAASVFISDSSIDGIPVILNNAAIDFERVNITGLSDPSQHALSLFAVNGIIKSSVFQNSANAISVDGTSSIEFYRSEISNNVNGIECASSEIKLNQTSLYNNGLPDIQCGSCNVVGIPDPCGSCTRNICSDCDGSLACLDCAGVPWGDSCSTSGGITTGSITTALITSGVLSTAMITSGSLTTALITSGTLSTSRITSGALSTSLITSGSLTTALITSGSLTTGLITTGVSSIILPTSDDTKISTTAGPPNTAESSTGAMDTLDSATNQVDTQTEVSSTDDSSQVGTSTDNNPDSSRIIGGVIGGMLGVATLAAILVVVIRRRAKKNSPRDLIELDPSASPPSREPVERSSSYVALRVSNSSVTDKRVKSLVNSGTINEIKDINLGESLGRGNFGEVYKGTAWGDTTQVALKKLTSEDSEEFLSEAAMLTKIKHPNCVMFLGIFNSPSTNELYIVTEYCPNGNLLQYFAKSSVPDFTTLVRIALDVAKGMTYLEENNVVHRDLAARNVLIDANGNAKVADFGLSRSLESDYYKVQDSSSKTIPVRWSAPEVIDSQRYSSKSDVWSMGITLYEIFTVGKVPYRAMTNHEVVQKVVDEGYRMPQPKGVPDNVWALISDCLKELPQDRPTLKEVATRLREMMSKLDIGAPASVNSHSEDYIKSDIPDDYARLPSDYARFSSKDERRNSYITI
eukprot:TRINITY_DN3800_c0_g1_i1.p1 TRINITY_DN3800_c0_g1~~TRINITY_DN3800_c0_g1_i1.p1  ORF type:complete len:971 (-),score=147.96 TRINITY_DN3800_c0_g1_i1:17-2929(-)